MHAQRSADAPQEPEPATTLAGIRETARRAGDALSRMEAVLAAIEDGTPPPDWLTPHELGLLVAAIRHAGANMNAYAREAEIAAFKTGVDDVALSFARSDGLREGLAMRRPAPRKPRQPGRGQLALVPETARQAGVTIPR